MSLQSERVPHKYTLQEQSGTSASADIVTLQSQDIGHNPFTFTFEAVRPGIFRTTFSSADHPLPPFPSAARLEQSEAKTQKISKDATAKTATIVQDDNTVRATVEWTHAPTVTLFLGDQQVYSDLRFRSYAVDGKGVAHYSDYRKGELYVGLGEKAAPMNLAGRSFRVTASDTFGYDAYRTDPLYKHIPLLIHMRPDGKGAVGIFSTSHARGTWCVGSEIDGMWGHFKVYRQAWGGLEQYLLVGRNVQEVVRRYAEVVGFPLLAPRYMMGYVSGGMKYTMHDDPPAEQCILGFLDQCRKHDIPVSAFQMSSGYTIAETEPKTRNVFTWNHHRFPDPRAFTAACHQRHVRLLANIKPYVLDNHPAFAELVKGHAFFRDPTTDKHGVARLWSAGGGESGEGAHLDFSSRAAFDWWYQGCKALREVGIDAMWNDNNEFNIFDDDWELALETVPTKPADPKTSNNVGLWGRAMHTELMGKSSHDACVAVVPDERPLVLTRSATAGTMKYACSSWSGDNVTSWDGMKGANAISLNANFSLLHCFGHDIGGFEGPQPSPELLVRWIQLGIHQPRFAINCYKTSPDDNLVGAVIEPWMHPSATPLVRAAIKRRYELIPYTYSLALQSHLDAVPPMRWTGWGFESDPVVWSSPSLLNGDTQFWFGDSLLVAGVYEEGGVSARVYLPSSADASHYGFLNTNAPFGWLAAGAWHDVPAPWFASIPVLARVGGAVPVGKNQHTTSRKGHAAEDAEFPDQPLDDYRGLEIFPPPIRPEDPSSAAIEAEFVNVWLEDDGISAQGRSSIYKVQTTYAVQGAAANKSIRVHAKASVEVAAVDKTAPAWKPLWLDHGLDIILPVGEERDVQDAEAKGLDTRGRRVWHIKVEVE